MDKRLALNLLVSLFLHFLALVLLLLSGGGLPGKKPSDGDKKGSGLLHKGVEVGEIIPKEKPTEITMVETAPKKEPEISVSQLKKKKLIDADKECPNEWYGGIGVRNTYDSIFQAERIVEVFPGYAADIAGLKPGDLILWISDEQIIGEPGTSFYMKVLRNGQVLDFKLTRVKVCYR